jgi:hypothetical protein
MGNQKVVVFLKPLFGCEVGYLGILEGNIHEGNIITVDNNKYGYVRTGKPTKATKWRWSLFPQEGIDFEIIGPLDDAEVGDVIVFTRPDTAYFGDLGIITDRTKIGTYHIDDGYFINSNGQWYTFMDFYADEFEVIDHIEDAPKTIDHIEDAPKTYAETLKECAMEHKEFRTINGTIIRVENTDNYTLLNISSGEFKCSIMLSCIDALALCAALKSKK